MCKNNKYQIQISGLKLSGHLSMFIFIDFICAHEHEQTRILTEVYSCFSKQEKLSISTTSLEILQKSDLSRFS